MKWQVLFLAQLVVWMTILDMLGVPFANFYPLALVWAICGRRWALIYLGIAFIIGLPSTIYSLFQTWPLLSSVASPNFPQAMNQTLSNYLPHPQPKPHIGLAISPSPLGTLLYWAINWASVQAESVKIFLAGSFIFVFVFLENVWFMRFYRKLLKGRIRRDSGIAIY